TQRHHRIADPHRVGVADVGHRKATAGELEYGDVVLAVEPDDAGREGLAIGDGPRGQIGRAGDHVVVGQDHAGVDHDAGPGADRALESQLGVDVDDLRTYHRAGRCRVPRDR